MTETSHKGKLVVISGPSGVGKSTICRRAVAAVPEAYLSVSATTRAKGPGEADGRDYVFTDKQQFTKGIEEGRFLEWAEVFGNYYGTPLEPIKEALAENKAVILEIDVQGGRQTKQSFPDAVLIFILPPTRKELAKRLTGRGRDDIEAASRRLDAASAEIAAAWELYDHMVINDDLEQAVAEVVNIIKNGENE